MRVRTKNKENSWIIIFSYFGYFFVDENLTIKWERDSQSKLSVSELSNVSSMKRKN